jgi:hypothetical protein
MRFIIPQNLDYIHDEFFIEVKELIEYQNIILYGSYSRYGKNKACDMDCNEFIDKSYFISNFINYINKLITNKKKKFFYFIYARFNEPYKKLEIIRNKLGYLNGSLNNHTDILKDKSIINDINQLPIKLKTPLYELFMNYVNDNTLSNFIKIRMFIKQYIYPNWTLKQLLKGTITYYDQQYNIANGNYTYFTYEIIYKNFRISNYIKFEKDTYVNLGYVESKLHYIIINDNIFYYKLLKLFMYFIKWLFFNVRTEKELHNSIITVYNNCFHFIDKIGEDNNKCGLIKNQIDIYKIKLNKNKRKYKKTNNKKYIEKITQYENKIKIKQEKYLNGIKSINDSSFNYFSKVITNYKYYFENYFKLY